MNGAENIQNKEINRTVFSCNTTPLMKNDAAENDSHQG